MRIYHGSTKKSRNFPESVRHAINGFFVGLITERNLRWHILGLVLVLLLSWWVKLPKGELSIIILISALVISLELVNSSVEEVADAVHPEYDERIQRAKDTSAAAVLFASLAALAIGIALFASHISVIVQ